MIKEIKLEDLLAVMQSDPTLVIGPGVTTHHLIDDEMRDHIKHGVGDKGDTPSSLQDFVDRLALERPELQAKVRSLASEFLGLGRPSNIAINYLIKPTWSAVISLTPDLVFLEAYSRALDDKPFDWKIATVSDPAIVLPQKIIPYYNLLGDFRELAAASRLSLSGSEYRDRRRVGRKCFARPMIS